MSATCIKNFKSHISGNENTVRTTYGISVSVINYGAWTDCSDCIYDPDYRRSNNPNCKTCSGKGKVPAQTTYVENVLPIWITEENAKTEAAGLLQAGDVKLKARLDSKTYWINAMENNIVLSIDSKDMLVKRVITNIVNTAIDIFCSRTAR